jgi:hypothetical protein
MKLYQGALLIAAMVVGPAASMGCNQLESDSASPDQTAPQAPPAPQAESPGAAPGQSVWSTGFWRWEKSKFDWAAGHWEPKRDGFEYVQGRWIEKGGRWEHLPGHWVKVRR